MARRPNKGQPANVITTTARVEAIPLAAETMTAAQRQAAAQVYGLLKNMHASPPQVGTHDHAKSGGDRLSFLPRIDDQRHNQVILINGDRGSGKTTVMLSLLSAWNQALRGEAIPADCKEWCEPDQRWIVPVALLDLHPLPRTVSLLLHLVHLFGRVVDALDGQRRGVEGNAPAWVLREEGESESRRSWKELVRCVAAGWDSNLPARSGTLDLEAYAVELDEAVRKRSDLVGCFTEFLDNLGREFCKGTKQDHALFLIAIDDADTNPQRSVELIDLVRQLYHPRLAFLLTGNGDLFVRTLRERILGELLGPLRGLPLAGDATTEQGRYAERLAYDMYEKAIPLSHHAQIPALSSAERLSLKSVGLREALQRVKVLGDNTLAHYFKLEPQLCEALPDRLRDLIELREFVRHAAARGAGPLAASEVVAQIWRDATRRPYLDLSVPAGFPQALSVQESGALRLELSGGNEIARERIVEKVTYPVWNWGVWAQFAWPEELSTAGDGKRAMPARVNAALLLAANVMADQPGADWTISPSNRSGYAPFVAWGLYQPSYRFAWPLPNLITVLDLAVLSRRWREAAQGRWKPVAATPIDPDEVDRLARLFLLLVYHNLRRAPVDPDLLQNPWSWEEAARAIVSLGEVHREEQPTDAAGRSWAQRRAGLLAAPESGLHPTSAARWLKALAEASDPRAPEKKFVGLPEAMRHALVLEQRRRSAFVQGKDPAAVVVDPTPTALPGSLPNPPPERDGLLDDILSNAKEANHPWMALLQG